VETKAVGVTVANRPVGEDGVLPCVPDGAVAVAAADNEVVPSGATAAAHRERGFHLGMARLRAKEQRIRRTGCCRVVVDVAAVAVAAAAGSAVAAGTVAGPGRVDEAFAAASAEPAAEPLGVADIAVVGSAPVVAADVAAWDFACGSDSGGPGQQTLPCRRFLEYP
jgi:hypothetical protein